MIGTAAAVLLAETRRRPGRLLLTGVTILLATVFAAGTLLLGETLRPYVASSTQETPSGAAVVVRPPPEGLLPPVDGVASTVAFADTTLPVSGAGATSGWEIASDPMISVLTLGVGLTSALLVALASTEADAQASIDWLFPTDIAVSTPDPQALTPRLGVDPAVVVVSSDATSVYVDPAPGVDDAAARAAVDTAVAGQPDVIVQYASDARADVESVVLVLRLVGLGLVGMTMLVAVVGVAVTLLLSITERTRETGLLRAPAVGCGPWWRGRRRWAGGGAGPVVGAVYGVLGTQVLGVGFTVGSVPTLAVLVVGVVAVAVLAAAVPAVRAGRVTPMQALQDA